MAQELKAVRIDRFLHEECKAILEELGMPVSVGINIFLKYIVHENGIPFLRTSKLSGVSGATTARSIRVDPELYDNACEILRQQEGIPISTAMNLYFEAIAETRGIPFELKLTDEGEQA